MNITKQQFIDKFTDSEFTAILSASKTDIQVEGWVFRFNNSGSTIDTLDARVINGLDLLVSKNLLTQARADEISGRVWGAWTVGQNVRILAPFDAEYPGTHQIQGFDIPQNVIIVAGTAFDPQYVEAV